MSIRIDQKIGESLREEIRKYRKEHNIEEPEEVKKFYNPNTTFLEEELEYITEIEGDAYIMENIIYFPNLKKISLKNGKSIKSKDIEKVAEACPDLTDLVIVGQESLTSVDLSKFEKLESISIKSNSELRRIEGLRKLTHRDDKNTFLYSFECYDNRNLMKSNVISICNNLLYAIEDGTKCNLDVLYYPEMKSAIKEYNERLENDESKISLEYKDVTWSERINHQPDHHSMFETKYAEEFEGIYSSAQMEMADKIADKILDTYIDWKDTQKQKYAILHYWMQKNIKYNNTTLKDPKRMESRKYKLNANGTLEALVEKKCVCEGYSRTMQYLLRKCAIEAEHIACLTNENKVRKNRLGQEIYVPGDHSILLVNLDDTDYYSDVTWDAEYFQEIGDDSGRYFLLSSEEMKRDRRILDEDLEFRNCEPMSKQERKELIDFAQNRVERGKDETNAHSQRFGQETKDMQKNPERMNEVANTMNRQIQNQINKLKE